MTKTSLPGSRFGLVLAAAALGALALVSVPTSTATAATPAFESAPIGFGAGTTGGAGGPTVTVTSASALASAVADNNARIVRVSGTFTGSSVVKIGSNKTIIGVGSNAGLVGIELSITNHSNVIIRNLSISKVQASSGDGDAIHIQQDATHIWVDHNDLSSDLSHGKDFYDGLVDITHASDFITVSWNKLHDHFKVSLVGHSDSNGSEDTGHLRVTYSHNWFENVNSRLPSLRFGTGHAYDNFFDNVSDSAVHSRENAQFLVQNNVFRNTKTCITTTGDSPVDGFVNQSGNDFGGCTNDITRTGTFTNPPYSFTLDATSAVQSEVTAGAGVGKVSG